MSYTYCNILNGARRWKMQQKNTHADGRMDKATFYDEDVCLNGTSRIRYMLGECQKGYRKDREGFLEIRRWF